MSQASTLRNVISRLARQAITLARDASVSRSSSLSQDQLRHCAAAGDEQLKAFGLMEQEVYCFVSFLDSFSIFYMLFFIFVII